MPRSVPNGQRIGLPDRANQVIEHVNLRSARRSVFRTRSDEVVGKPDVSRREIPYA